MDVDVILKRFENPDECREMILGRFEIVRLGGLTVGRATYQPGWKWSTHVGPGLGLSRCPVEHVGLVVAGEATAAFEDVVSFLCELATCSIFLPCRTTVGSLAMFPMCPCISWARTSMQNEP
jgi:hypothetical protein